MTIGQRAARMIRETAQIEGIKVSEELKMLGATRKTFGDWESRGLDPSAYWLQQLALAGYDVFWILTGERSYPVTEHDPEIGEYEEEL